MKKKDLDRGHKIMNRISAALQGHKSLNFSPEEQGIEQKSEKFKVVLPKISYLGKHKRLKQIYGKARRIKGICSDAEAFLKIMEQERTRSSTMKEKKTLGAVKKLQGREPLSQAEMKYPQIKMIVDKWRAISEDLNKRKDVICLVLSYSMRLDEAYSTDYSQLSNCFSQLNRTLRTFGACPPNEDSQKLWYNLSEADIWKAYYGLFLFAFDVEPYLPPGWTYTLDDVLEYSSHSVLKYYTPEEVNHWAYNSTICQASQCIMEGTMNLIAISGADARKVIKALRDISSLRSKFNVVMYIYASQHHNTEEVQTEIAQNLHEFSGSTDNINIILPLDEALKSVNFLLLFDCVDGGIINLHDLKVPLAHGCIVIATQSDNIYQVVTVDLEIKMEYHLLPWDLFCRNVGNEIHASSDFEEVAIRLVEACDGNLLAIVLLARALEHVNDIGLWKLALHELTSKPSSVIVEGTSQVMVRVLKFVMDRKDITTKLCVEYLITFFMRNNTVHPHLVYFWFEEALVGTTQEGHVIFKDLVNSFLLEDYFNNFRMREETRVALNHLLPAITSQLMETPTIDWDGRGISITSSEEFKLPKSPNCPHLLRLFLKNNDDLIKIPHSFFEHMPLLQVLDLSYTSIKALPTSLYKLFSLRKLLLRDCKLFMVLSPQIGKLSNLEVLDMEGTEIMYLPEDIGRLEKLKRLRLSFYGHGKSYRESKQVDRMIPKGIFSNFRLLQELSIDVNPNDEEWSADVEDIMADLYKLYPLNSIKLYVPKAELLSTLRASKFRLTVCHNKQIMTPRVPHEVEEEFKNHDRALKYVCGKHIPNEIMHVLKVATAFFLDRHWTSKRLSDFGNKNMNRLKYCCLVGCNELETIIEQGEVQRIVFESLNHLGVYYMKSLKSVCKGSIAKGSFSKLKRLSFITCTNLTSIFTQCLLCNLDNLEELLVEDCPKIKSLVSQEPPLEKSSTLFLPCLKKMSLLELPELVSISSGFCIAPKLEMLVIFYCLKLEKLSSKEASSKDLKVIKGESEWWNSLTWDKLEWNSDHVDYLDSIFVPLTM
ncbi:hypothetical protein NMG60_11032498 [Bertholletia excelsa]